MGQDTTVKTTISAAIGAPAQLISTLWRQVSVARVALDDVRDRFTDEVGFAFVQGTDDGERLFETWGNELSSRRAAVSEALRVRTGMVREVGGGFAARTDAPAPVHGIDGIGPAYAEKLARAGVRTAGTLVERCRTYGAADTLAEQTGISAGRLRGWANRADLSRIESAGTHMMAMLNGFGIATVDHLEHADASDLRSRAMDPFGDPTVITSTPSDATVGGWIDGAAVNFR